MTHRFVTACGSTALAMVVLLASAQGQTTNVPRLPWGDPDLEGTWTNATLTPLQRATELETKAFFTPEEAAAFEKQRIDQTNADRPPRPGEVIAYNNVKFNHQSRFGVGYLNGLSDENLRVVERFTRTDANTLVYQATIEDPTVFTRPWTIELPMQRTENQIFEVACHEGNYGLGYILSGHRAEERAAK